MPQCWKPKCVSRWFRWNSLVVLSLAALGGCPTAQVPPPENVDNGNDTGAAPSFSNTTDKTNAGATYLTSSACRACHPTQDAAQYVHGHAWKLNAVQGQPPNYPDAGERAGVPNPPDGFTWNDISYVIGGYTKKARFVDQDGFVLTNGVAGVNTQWNLAFPANGSAAASGPIDADVTTPKPMAFETCFICHTTGPKGQDAANPRFQDNRPGIPGTWEEAGIQCEACHGPGSGHFTTASAEVVIDKSRIFVDTDGAQTCKQCHNRPFDSKDGIIRAKGGFILNREQWPELQASGAHASLTCITCHDPHYSTIYDRPNGIRRQCADCHADHSLALHEGKTFIRGDYVETLTCESCHMPFATRSATNARAAVVGPAGRMGDVRTHIVRINTDSVDYKSLFNADLTQVQKDAQGQAAITVDFVCLRCHNGIGSAFELTLPRAAEIAGPMHKNGY